MLRARRVKWLEGRRANVDGIAFQMPVGTKGSPALCAGYLVDPVAVRAMLPGQELHPLRLGDRGLLLLTVVDYGDTAIGRYVEFCIGLMCTRGRRSAPTTLPLLARRLFGTGFYIYDLPVSTEVSVKGGRGIWGMGKRQANLDFVVGDESVSSQYDLDGELVLRVDVPSHHALQLPFRLTATGYGDFRGMLTKSYVSMAGRMGVSLGGGRRASLVVGDSPRAEPLKRLDIASSPLFTAYLPAMHGVLDDHVETWFLTADADPGRPKVGLDSVVGLGLSQEWLPPPNREVSDRMLREMTPSERVGRR